MTVHISEFVVPQQITGCRLATETNVSGVYYNGLSNNGVGATLTTNSSTLTIDSVSVANNDSVLLANQTSGFQNGIYVVSGVGVNVILTRRYDFQCAAQMVPGYYLTITSGVLFAGKIFTIALPQVSLVGVSNLILEGPIPPTPPTTLTLKNNGLNVYNPAETFLNHIVPPSDITADRQFSLITGDQATSLDLSAAVNFVPTAFGGTLAMVDTKFTALNDINLKAGTGPAANVAGTSHLYPAATILATDIVQVCLTSCTNPAYIVGFLPVNGGINVQFNTSPGANTSITFLGLPTL